MSKLSTVYDRILVELATLYPSASGYTRIPYAYDLEKNDDNLLRLGWGVVVGPAERVDLEWCNLAFSREVTIVLTRESFNTGNDEAAYDAIVKGLIEDCYKVQDRFYEPDQLAIEASIVKVDPLGATGIEQVEGDRVTFLTASTSFSFLIREDI